MIYIRLSQSIQGYDVVRIKELHFFDSDDNEKTPMSVGFKYQVCVDIGGKYSELYNKFITLEDEKYLSRLFSEKMTSTCYDSICRVFLEYILSRKIVEGTLEVK